MRAESIQYALERIELLAGFAKLALGGEALVVGEVFAGFRDERVDICRGLGCSLGRRRRLWRLGRVQRRNLSTKKGRSAPPEM